MENSNQNKHLDLSRREKVESIASLLAPPFSKVEKIEILLILSLDYTTTKQEDVIHNQHNSFNT
jgi:hypothetical protein